MEWVCDIRDAAMQIDHMQNHPGEAWRGRGIYVFFAHRKLSFHNVLTDCSILHFAMHDACVMSDVHVCRKCQKNAESLTAIVVKPTCAKIYLRSWANHVAATAAPKGSRDICFTPPAQKFSINVCRKCQKDAESSTAVVVKPTCAKIYLRSRADRVTTTVAPNRIT
jgi:hypothetical protein